MRNVTKQVVRAFLDGKARTIKNTSTDGNTLYLHGNAIAWREMKPGWPYNTPTGGICMSLAGWNSLTTRERLNGLCDMLFKQRPFHSKDWGAHFAGTPIDSDDILVWYPGITDANQMLTANMMIEPSHREAA